MEHCSEREDIILVDDETQILESLTRQLRLWAEHNSLNIRACQDAESALKVIGDRADQVAILVSDNRMPKMQGTELIQRVGKLRLPVVPIMLTGYTDKVDIQAALSAGVFSLLVKPWSRDELLQELDFALETFRSRKSSFTGNPELKEQEYLAAKEFSERFFSFSSETARYNVEIDHHQETVSESGISRNYLDIISLTEHSFLMLVGSIAGHGLEAVFVAAIIKSMLYRDFVRYRLTDDFDPGELLGWMNTKLSEITASMPEMFMTFVACKINRERGEVVVANAGNPFPVKRSGDEVLDIVTPGVALGVNDKASYRTLRAPYRPGDTLFVFTDGVTGSGEGTPSIDSNSLHSILEQADPEDSIPSILSRIQQAAGLNSFTSDVSFIRATAKDPDEPYELTEQL